MSNALFEPITLRGMTARNRIWVPPMCQFSVEAQDGVATEWHRTHLAQFARGGAGAIILESTAVTADGRISPWDLGLWNDQQEDSLADIVATLQASGTKVGVQLSHAGRKGSTGRPWGGSNLGTIPATAGGWPTVGPSAIAYGNLNVPTELTEPAMRDLVERFVDAAVRAVRAGFDFVEFHGAHGYLLHQFLSPLSNHRTDAYGGSLENRARLLLEVLDSIRSAVPDRLPIAVRLSATDWTEGGITVDETTQVGQWLRERGADFLDVSTGGNVPASIPIGLGYQVPFATAVRSGSGLPVSAVGLIIDPVQAEEVVATGLADVVLVGREHLRDPNFTFRVAKEQGVDLPYRPPQYDRAYR